jgi:hypothetical protein
MVRRYLKIHYIKQMAAEKMMILGPNLSSIVG